MPDAQQTEKVVIVRLDREGNIINYETAERPIADVKSSSINHSQPVELYDEEKGHEYYSDDDYSPENTSVVTEPRRKTYRDSTVQTTTTTPRRRRRLRYVPPKSTVKIIDERVGWNAHSKIDTRNDEAIEQIQRTPRRRIVDERVTWHVKPKINTYNEAVIDEQRSERRLIMFNENDTSISKSSNDNNNDDYEYITFKNYERSRRHDKTYIQNYPQEQKRIIVQSRIDNQNPEYEEYKQRQKSARFPPIQRPKALWQPSKRYIQNYDEYLQRRQKHRAAASFRWNYVRPTLDNHNEDYIEHSKGPRKPRIVNQLPHWRSEPKLNTFNDSYNLNLSRNPKIIDEKIQWHARSKLDTGFVPDSDDDEYINHGSTT